MSFVYPEPGEDSRPLAMALRELTFALDDSEPLPRRAAIVYKWYFFFADRWNPGGETPPTPDKMTPDMVRELASKIIRVIASLYGRKGESEPV